MQPHVDPVRDKPGLLERKPGGRGKETTIVYATSGNLTQEAKGRRPSTIVSTAAPRRADGRRGPAAHEHIASREG